MRILKSPITHDGHVRYFELIKILVLVMAGVMSFSYGMMALNPLFEFMTNLYFIGTSLLFLGGFIYTLYEDVKEIIEIITSTVVPWLVSVIPTFEVLYADIQQVLYYHKTATIKKADNNTICVMRC